MTCEMLKKKKVGGQICLISGKWEVCNTQATNIELFLPDNMLLQLDWKRKKADL